MHWARDADEATAIVVGLVRERGTDEVVKVKSMATAEIGLNEALAAAERLAADDVDAEVIDLRCLIPLDARAVLDSVARTSRLVIVEENPYQGGWGGTLASIVAEEGFYDLDAPVMRLATADVPSMPYAPSLEAAVLLTADRIYDATRRLLQA